MAHEKEGYPHIHAILQFSDARIRVQNARYFDRRLYKEWKNRWKHGLSDVQPPRGSGTHVLAYVLKYCLKNATSATVWKKVLPKEDYSGYVISAEEQPTQSDPPRERTINTHSVPPVKKYGVKYLTWSRNFDFKPFIVENNNKPCPKRDLSTHLTFK